MKRNLPDGFWYVALIAGLASCTSILGTFEFANGTGGSSTTSSGTAGSTGANGQPCTAPSDCASGFCADSVCCNTVCTEACHACIATLTGVADGTCAGLIPGTPAPTGQCAPDLPCGNDGKCGAGGVCEQPAAGVACGTTCASATLANNQCNGMGTCAGASTSQCAGSLNCNTAGTACLTTCAMDTDCTSGHFCSNGACMLEAGLGMPCTGADQCPSGFCVDGVCCNSACDASMCSACNLSGSEGICSTEPNDQNNSNHACAAGSACCGGACTSLDDVTSCGTCATTCTTANPCLTPTCATGQTCGTTPVTTGTQCSGGGGTVCNGSGTCVQCNAATDCSGTSSPGCCGNTCIDLDTSSTNCGACGHDCLGGACTAGVCQPVILTTFGAGTNAGAFGMAIDSMNVYWAWDTATSGAAMQVPLAGGTAITLASGSCLGIAVNAANVFFTSGNNPASVDACKIGGCGGTPTPLTASEESASVIALDSTYVYWADYDLGEVRYMALVGGAGPFVLADVGANSLASDATNVYWTGGGTVAYTPHGVPGKMGAVTTLATGLNGSDVALDSTYVYFDNFEEVDGGTVGTVQRVPIAGGTVATVATASTFTNGLAVDATDVYYFDGNSLMKCALPSCTAGTPIAPNRISSGPVVVDSVAVYWVETETVLRVAK